MASGSSPHGAAETVEALGALVASVRRRVIAVSIATGLVLVAAVAVAWVVGGVVVDLVVPLGVPARVAAWCGWWLAVAAAAAAFLAVPAWRRPVLDAVALRIERAVGGMQNRLLTVLDLGRRPGHLHRTRPDLLARLLDQTRARLEHFRPGSVIRWDTLRRGTGLAAVALATGLALFGGFGERFTTTLSRLLSPTADIPPATLLQFAIPGDIEVLVDEPLEIAATVERGSAAAADLVLDDGSGRQLRYPMRRDGERFVVALEGLGAAARYRVEGGGTWTRTHTITVLDRPAIEALVPAIRLPAYMRIDAPLPVIGSPARIEAPEGATVEFTARVRPDAAAGEATLTERTVVTDEVEAFDERVWFEDDLPRDAVVPQPWRWTTAHASGGLKAFVCEAGRAATLRTRLEPLLLPRDTPADKAFMVMARTDPASPPRRIAVRLESETVRLEIVWGDGSGAPVEGVRRFVAGPLPEPGAWTRLWAPLASLPALAGRSVGTATFEVDGGRAVLDRPGWMTRGTRRVERAVDRETGRVAARREATAGTDGGRWLAAVPVAARTWATVSFVDAHGHRSVPVPPVEIVPTVDRPPALVVASPAEMLPLEVPDDVVIEAEAFDDWGIDSIAIRIGPDGDHLAAPEPLAGVSPADRPPDARIAFTTSVTAERLGLEPGRGAAWKLVVRDTKGQEVESSLHRVTVVLPPDNALAESQVPALEQARRFAEEMAANAAREGDGLDRQREQLLEAVGSDTLAALEQAARAAEAAADGQPDGERDRAAAAAAASAQQKGDEAAAALGPQDRAALERLERFLAARRDEARRVEEALRQAAAQAAGSPLVPPPIAAEIGALADEAGKLGESLDPEEALEAAAAQLERIARAPEPSAIAEAAARLARAAKQTGTKLDAAGAARRIETLADDLARRATDLAASAQRRDEAAAAAAAAAADTALPDTDRAAALARQRQEERVATTQVGEVEQILGRPVAPASASAAPNPDAQAAAPAAPADAPAAAAPSPPDGAAPPPPAADPLAARIAAGRDEAAEAGAMAERLTGQLTGQLPLSGPPAADDRREGDAAPGEIPAPAADAPAARPRPAADSADGAAVDEPLPTTIDELLASREVREALRMADRARRIAARKARNQNADGSSEQGEGASQPGDGDEPGDGQGAKGDGEGDSEDPGDSPTDGGGRNARRDLESPLRGLDARQRAALERLPPRVRDPLLEGMREQGPAAYREVIDTYFRRLGKDVAPAGETP
ncbi:MAG: hypothetical protein KGQ61_05250 [Planctomycetes bacterium]|nr:hypothetical protein [Planctomycetota bacterium]